MWLDCVSGRAIGKQVGVDHTTVDQWVVEKVKSDEFHQPPASRQHFDVWQFAKADKDAGPSSIGKEGLQ